MIITIKTKTGLKYKKKDNHFFNDIPYLTHTSTSTSSVLLIHLIYITAYVFRFKWHNILVKKKNSLSQSIIKSEMTHKNSGHSELQKYITSKGCISLCVS